jgi:hypothetical protein
VPGSSAKRREELIGAVLRLARSWSTKKAAALNKKIPAEFGGELLFHRFRYFAAIFSSDCCFGGADGFGRVCVEGIK